MPPDEEGLHAVKERLGFFLVHRKIVCPSRDEDTPRKKAGLGREKRASTPSQL